MGVKRLFKTGVGGRVSGLARRLVVLALIGAAFAASFATSAVAFELRPPDASNHVFHYGPVADTVRHIYRLAADDLSFGGQGVVRITPYAESYCSMHACCSYYEYRSVYPNWWYRWCVYDGRSYLLWLRTA